MSVILGIDVNMGCPKPFSIKGGMGAALLSQPELVERIIRSLVEAVPDGFPITAKIRLLHSQEKTLQLACVIEKAGAVALAVHGRFQEQVRPPSEQPFPETMTLLYSPLILMPS
jgi:tRNA-dihydrouridine synthase 2